MSISINEIKRIHGMCFKNMAQVKLSATCQCFYCLKTYSSSDVVDSVKESDGQRTAICPKCDIDSVIPSASIVLSDEDLKTMQIKYFIEDSES